MALSPLHSRQLIVHGHVRIGERLITIPGYGVSRDEEGSVELVGKRSEEGEKAIEPVKEGAPADTPEVQAEPPAAK